MGQVQPVGIAVLFLLSPSHPGVGVSFLLEHHFKVSLRSSVPPIDQSGAGTLFRWET